ncbi:hypothetical protein T11_17351 [Trichinella zimbabwensis]|uniref:Uncharacterized protein n=1 Tax=Trichinella zimbabwensis TaxID=268475 RepID=A0A0V1GJC9_9BILA|nr:hypothetical protein T11_17351 [Trichinella zimbabwensis]
MLLKVTSVKNKQGARNLVIELPLCHNSIGHFPNTNE